MTHKNILMIGCGEMGGAMLHGWHHALGGRDGAPKFTIVCPDRLKAEKVMPQAAWHASPQDLSTDTPWDVIVFAVKPDVLVNIASSYHPFMQKTTLCVSIAAGITTATLTTLLLKDVPIVRAMPNLPVLQGAGATLLYNPQPLDAQHKEMLTALFQALGKAYWIEKESLFGVGTALSGCGPGFVSYFFSCLVKSAIAYGMGSTLAEELAHQLLQGTAAYTRDKTTSFDAITDQVAVSGGMTAAGLKYADLLDFPYIIDQVFHAAIARGQQLDSQDT